MPREWVDIPEWAGDYYLAVQVNLSEGWLRVWGFATHQKLKESGNYDKSDRAYCLDGSELLENLNIMWAARKRNIPVKAPIEPLTQLADAEAESLVSKATSLYFPRLQIAFPQWAAMLASAKWRQQLYEERLGK